MEKIKNINIDSTKMVNQFNSTTNNSNYTTMQGNKITKIDSSPVEEMNMEQTSLGSFLASFIIGGEVAKIIDDQTRQELASWFASNGLSDDIYGYNGSNIVDIGKTATGILVTLENGTQYLFNEEFGKMKLASIGDGNAHILGLDNGISSLRELFGSPTNKAGDYLPIENIYFVNDTLYVEVQQFTNSNGEIQGGTYVIDPIKGEVQSVITDGYLGN